MKVYFDGEADMEVEGLTPKMLRQMQKWHEMGVANITLIGRMAGNKDTVAVHITRVHVQRSAFINHGL